VGLDELRLLRHDRLQGLARLFDVAHHEVERSHLVTGGGRGGPHGQRSPKPAHGLGVTLVLAQDHPEVEVGVVVVGVALQLLLELLGRAVRVAQLHQRLSQAAVRGGELRIELDRAREVVPGRGGLRRHETRHAHEQAGLRGITGTEDEVDEDLTARRLLVEDEGHAHQVGDGVVVGGGRLENREGLDDLLELSHAEVAVGEKEARVLVVGLARDHLVELLGRFPDLPGLVEGQGEVEPYGRARGIEGQGLAVLIDGLLVAALVGQGRAQIRADLDVAGLQLQEALITRDRFGKAAGLVIGQRSLDQRLGVLRLGDGQGRGGQGQDHEQGKRACHRRVPDPDYRGYEERAPPRGSARSHIRGAFGRSRRSTEARAG
jgi:hypothetical protein